jgi:hypothetical protein
MRRIHLGGVVGLLASVIVLSSAPQAGTKTYVALAGRDDELPKLGRPGVAVHVTARTTSDAEAVGGELARELAAQVHTRRLARDEQGDYDLTITLEEPRVDGSSATVPFEAVLASARGERLWRIEGRSDVEGVSLDASVYAGIGRNVISALIHDGWLQARYDPDDPPPPPPHLK